MAQDSKRGLFNSVFGGKKKTEEELEAEKESRRKLEDRIREVLVVSDPPQFEPAMDYKREVLDTTQIMPVPLFPAAPSGPTVEPEYTFMYLSPGTGTLRKPPSSSPFLKSLTPAEASQAH